ncbi:hypothetical protein C8A01DRAFT_44824 [Parachaetomium inaequale]|uniref:SET domain-containing protein n=1 Tax=Parachaetomium inaequale TaxID=2588326 RepID=A0AAN6PPD4_9PEZI|nr:hypothetical protein C8A01DRAFT_44824 [Parachaetomium inaequale]
MDVYDEVVRWAQDQGVELDGVAPRSLPGRGVGIVATRPLEANQRILHVPASVLRTLDTVRPQVKEALPKDTKVHAILAAELALDKPTSEYSPWNAVVPSRDSVSASLPLAWDARLHPYLPKPALALLRKQQAKFTRDWTAIQQTPLAAAATSQSTTPTITRQEYLHFWLLVNTRTFYHETPHTATLPRDDRMVLQPVADLFNHADTGCAVAFTGAGGGGGSGFTVTADRPYAAGEEVYICYGKHTNDFLLVEYGFVLETQNRWDEVCLDEAVLPALSGARRELLDERGFLGNYVLDAGTVCYRTQVAVRLLCVSAGEWERLVHEGEDGGEALQEEVDRLLVGMLRRYRGTVEGRVQEIEGLEVGLPSQREVLCTRWRQIGRLVEQTIERLES